MFVVHQRRTDAPALDLDLFRIPNFTWGNLAMLVFGTAFSALFFGSILFSPGCGTSPSCRRDSAWPPGRRSWPLVAPRAGKLAGRIGQRPLLIVGGLLYACSGVYRLRMLGPEVDYVVDYLPSMILSGLGVACCFPQLSSVVAQALPQNRIGIGGAALQAIRQFGGTFGVALTIAFLGTSGGPARALAAFDRVWVLIVIGGLGTALLVLPLRTRVVDELALAAEGGVVLGADLAP